MLTIDDYLAMAEQKLGKALGPDLNDTEFARLQVQLAIAMMNGNRLVDIETAIINLDHTITSKHG